MMNKTVPEEKILPDIQYGRERDFWLRTFSGELIKSHFPYDFRQPVDIGHSMDTASFRIDGELFLRLIQLIKGYDNRLHVILTCGLVVLMHRYTGNRDIIVGSPIYKQDVEGDFINTVLALRNQLQEDMTVKDLLVMVRQNLRLATENQNYPIQTLLYQLDLPFRENEFPLFDLVILLENIHKKEYIEHISHNVTFSFNREKSFISGVVEYRSSLYRQQTIEQIISHFICILDLMVSNLDAEILEIEVLSDQDRKQLIWEFNDTGTEYPLDKTINILLAEQASVKQDAIAVVYENEALTYKELEEKSHALATFLSNSGVTGRMPVGVMTERSLESIIGIVAILKAVGYYVPIDPEYPEERKQYIIDDCNIKILFTNCKTGGDYNCDIIDLEDIGRFTGLPRTNSEKFARSNDMAYIIYTSGSTGKPKGSMIEHRNVVRLVKNTNFIDFNERDRILQTGALEFDASTFEIWGALLNGLQLYLTTKDKVLSPDPLKDSIRKYEITTMWLTSPLFNQLVDADTEIFLGLRNLLVGGDTLSPPHINRVKQKYPALNIINGYGPTENTTFSTTYLIDKTFKENIPIGKPIANSTAYVFDTHLRLVPIGVSGELYVGGDGVARGYLNSPELTNTQFIVNRLGPGERLYKTGDRARWLPIGNIEFLGRIDFQVKIRGYRVEPGEIENYLMEIEPIRDVVVAARTGKDRETYLCAYVISHRHQHLDWQEIKKSLSKRLPDYMIPSYFVRLEEFPLTVNKKVDLPALPEPEMAAGTDYAPPGNEIEIKLVEIWSEVLKIEKEVIGIHADFFDLGGHSLKATTLAADIHKELGVKVALAEIFKTPTIKELAEYINDLGESKYSEIERIEEREYYNISSAQKRLYLLQKMDTNQTHYNIPVATLLQGKLNLYRLEESINVLIQRHEVLRTSFEMIDGETVQRITPDVNLKIDYYSSVKDASLGFNGSSSVSSEEFIIKGFIRAFDLSHAPLMRAAVIKREQHNYLLMVDMHHIITDGTSMGVFVQEFMELYNGKTLSPVGIQYKDFSQWQNNLIQSGEMQKQAEYWQTQLNGDIPVLNLPTDYSRPALQSFEGNGITFELNREHYLALKEIAKNEKTTLFIVLLAVYNIFISRLTLQEDIVVGIPTAGRRHANLKPIMGMFVNMLAVRNFPGSEKTAAEFLKDLNNNTLKAFENQDYQFEELVDQLELKRDTSRNPLFDTAFVLQNFEIPEIEISGLKLTPYNFEDTTSKFDLTMHGYESGSTLLFSLNYSTRLFKKESIKRFENYFKTLISSIIDNPGEKIANLEVIPRQEKERLLYDFNDTDAGYPVDKTIHQLFDRQVEKTPANEAVAFIDADTRQQTSLTYKELNEKANRLAGVLRRKGVKAGTIAAVLLERSIEMVTALLAILKAGGAYLPIEPDTPVKRISAMLEDSHPVIVLTRGSIVEKNSFAALKGLGQAAGRLYVSQLQPRIEDFDSIPFPDRSLVNYEKYNRFIGQAMVKNSIALQTTRGCPYHCLYCHKIWSKRHIERSAENIFAEIRLYYDMGVRRFVIIDDIFNLDMKNSSRLFELIIEKGLQLQLFFPNGLRGDLLTREYIDLMVEAGTVSLALALETASPRLQKLVKKNLNLHRLKENLQYFCAKYPHVILELFTMHGFPTETEQEATMTLDFIKDLKWLHFPYIHILKIYPNTDMETLALENGISTKAIAHSSDLAYHELPETLPFDKSFTLKYQADFLNSYFLSKERLLSVLPHQIKVLTEDELVQKYNSYLPTEIESFSDLLEAVGITREELNPGAFCREDSKWVPDLNRKIEAAFPASPVKHEALKVLLLDLSQFFSHGSGMLYDVVEPPLGLMYVQTYLNRKLGSRVEGRIAKSRIDFDNYEQLKSLLDEFKPDVIGMRTLTFYKDFFHQTAAMIRQWGFDGPVIAGGPYATSDYQTLLQDRSIDLVVLSEGETITGNLVEKIIENNGKLPDTQVLKEIPGIAFVPVEEDGGREILMLDALDEALAAESGDNPRYINGSTDLAYIIYTSGSTGKPKGSLIEHKNVVRLMVNDEFLFDFNSRDVWTMFHSYCFDFSVWEMYGALLYGGKLVVVPKMIARDPREYLDTLKSEGVTVLNQTPSAFYNLSAEMLSQPAVNLEVRYIIFGGEALKPGQLRGWRTRYPETALVNMYGITETTVHVTFKEIGNAEIESNISNIGKPIPTLRIYVLDRHLKPVPMGVGGEMYVGGDGVCRGYLNRPELTAEKFIHVNNDKLYKTGDLAKWTESGDLEYLGRVDQQVKIRGFRIEPAEIERYLSNHPDISKAIIIAGEAVIKSETGENRDKYLCAYILSDQSLEVPELRQYLALEFPDYMIPSYFIMVDEIPLTVNGKVDIKRLPAPGVTTNEDNIAPRDDIEEKLVEMWAEVLNLKPDVIGIDSNFFELGGHSLNAAFLIAKIQKELNVKIPLVEIFRIPEVRALAEYIKASVKNKYTAIEPAEEKEFYPLSSAQKRLYVLQQVELQNTAYNIPIVLELAGPLDKDKLQYSFECLINRHESLRTAFEIIAEEPVQVIKKEVDFKTDYYKAKRENIRGIVDHFSIPFDLSKVPLLRVGLIQIDAYHNILIMDIHHIINDGLSQEILVNDLISIYSGTEMPELRIQYKDYSEWLHREETRDAVKEQEQYWKVRFKDEPPLLNLPIDFPMPPQLGFAGKRIPFSIDRELTEKLKEVAAETGTTLYILLLAVYNIFLAKYTNQEDIVVGSPVLGRRLADLENVTGMFVNMLAMRNSPCNYKTFREFLEEVKQHSLNAFENQDYQFDELIEKLELKNDTSRHPLVETVFVFNNIEMHWQDKLNENCPELEVKPYDIQYNISKFDIKLSAYETGNQILFDLEYRTQLFKPEKPQAMCGHLVNLIKNITRDIDAKLVDLEIMDEEEKAQLVKSIKDNTNLPYSNAFAENSMSLHEIDQGFDF
jgi:amino acid adenylation domain-containing protein